MSLGCLCDGGGLGNLGVNSCAPRFSVLNKLGWMPIYDSTGVKNKIDLTGTIDEAFFQGLINEPDPSKRLYLSPIFENVKRPKGDNIYDTAPSDRKYEVKKGKKEFTGEHYDVPAQLEARYEGHGCGETGVFEIDIDGNFKGFKTSDDSTDLYPIQIDKKSFSTKFVEAEDTTVSRLMVAFDYNRLLKDSKTWMLTAEELGFDINDLEPLLEADITFVSKTSTNVVFDVKAKQGTALNRIAVEGLVTADLSLYDNTLAASVSITVVESSTIAGRYTATFTAISGSTSNLTLTLQKDGIAKTTLDFVDA
jgi:hypothetical protein